MHFDLALALPTQAYYQIIHTLTRGLPPPVADTQEALLARNQAAIDKVAAMMPTNADEADLAAQCVACRAQADDVLRLIRLHDGDTKVVMKLDAQYIAMVRTSTAVRRELRQVQALRHKREANSASLRADESTQYIAARLMQQALEAGPVPAAGAGQAAPAAGADPARAPESAPGAPPPAHALAAAPLAAPVAKALVSGPVAAGPPAPAAPEPGQEPLRPRRMAAPVEADDPPRDLADEADRYALAYPRRAREIRHYGGLPPDCGFGPPDDEVVQAGSRTGCRLMAAQPVGSSDSAQPHGRPSGRGRFGIATRPPAFNLL